MEEKKTYVVAYDEYMGVFPEMEEFVGTYRELLLHLIGADDVETQSEIVDGFNCAVKDLPTAELEKWSLDSNGDGQPSWQVYCVTDKAQVKGI